MAVVGTVHFIQGDDILYVLCVVMIAVLQVWFILALV